MGGAETNCKNTPIFRYTWPGRDEAFICMYHSLRLQGVANAMGLYIQLIPMPILTEDNSEEKICSQTETK
jgi:hypothetical protein